MGALGRPLPPAPEPLEGLAITDLAILADTIAAAAERADVPEQPSPWLPPLPAQVVIGEPEGLEFGVTDLPWAQRRRPLALDLERGGHLLIAGAARSGRSTALRTIAGAIAATASPADVHLHVVDCGSGAMLPWSRCRTAARSSPATSSTGSNGCSPGCARRWAAGSSCWPRQDTPHWRSTARRGTGCRGWC
ncbi:FtsK/SpoIIIE domain-containing protein [Nonomuraea recticatena]|uniref:FtsK/SpoIIIE domain-containing protein n=1 Tax=Nonomuraea recticatena TaxID=46178 RepID=UPI00360FA7CE